MTHIADEHQQEEFLEALAQYLVGDQAKKSILLSMGDSDAQVRAKMRSATPLFGYPTVAEATASLRRFLFNRD